ncbi:hypothetical protein FJN14_17165 [Alteromonas mediterranea]|uniref:hypothetical protein n=1 Tax=Alteromonas mediterranea TaxID=314275 RepID=UPI001130670D|nr:hypothetical protein [Alteromonas mediterranea]QDG40092.1 hypothetical protein FJN14_17165 [Alteromonas mediterranea]
MVRSFHILVFIGFVLTGCTTISQPNTIAENFTNYSYVPIDPLPVKVTEPYMCNAPIPSYYGDGLERVISRLQTAFPDQTVRLAVGEITASGGVNYGSTTIGVEGSTYQVIIDYMASDTVNGEFLARKEIVGQVARKGRFGFVEYEWADDRVGEFVGLFDPVQPGYVASYTILPIPDGDGRMPILNQANKKASSEIRTKDDFELISLPVYVGVGLRLTATINVLQGNVDLSGLPAIAAEARAGNLNGTMVVQTLGATGPLVSSNLPLPSELDRTTIQNAILAIGSIKALLNDESMVLKPRVVGIYNPFGGGQSFVNGVITSLALKPIEWQRPCIIREVAIP